jgi:hypothetical protein
MSFLAILLETAICHLNVLRLDLAPTIRAILSAESVI